MTLSLGDRCKGMYLLCMHPHRAIASWAMASCAESSKIEGQKKKNQSNQTK